MLLSFLLSLSLTLCPHLQPWTVQPSDYFVCRDTYAIDINSETKLANWVAYCIDEDSISGSSANQNRYWKDEPDLPPETVLEPEDYQGIGRLNMDRGHLAPLASFRGENWTETNYMSNIVPMTATLNQGPWLQLEKHERRIVKKYGQACIITGPYFTNEKMGRLLSSDELHQIPNGFWKVIQYDKQVEGYLFRQNVRQNLPYKAGRKCLELIENAAGFDITERQDICWN